MAILEAAHYFMAITIFTISSLIYSLQQLFSSSQVFCQSTPLL